MLSVAEARALMLARVEPLDTEETPLESALGRVLAAPLMATRDQPPFASSAMDGYAMASAETARTVEIVGESAAGRGFVGVLQVDQAVRISTGAPIPTGADGVLIQEDAAVTGSQLLNANVKAGRHVRPRGGDFRAGDELLERGRRLDPVAIGLAAGAGAASLRVMRRPVITVFAGGDELVKPGANVRPDQIYESCSLAVCGLIEQWGGIARRAESLPDDQAAITKATSAALKSSDLIVLIGGASVGPHDHARPALQRLGVDIIVPKISVRPGKPTWFGVSPHGRALGLPGNAASAIVCAILFLRPLMEGMAGRNGEQCVRVGYARLAAPLDANGPRESYLRARLQDDESLLVFDDQDSSLMLVLSKSNALVMRPASAPPLAAGEVAPYLVFGAP